MKRLTRILTILLLAVSLFWGWSYAGSEGLKTFTIPNTDFKVTLPEQAPDFLTFPTDIVAQMKYDNGNGVVILESLNKEHTVDVIIVMAKVGKKIGLIQMQVNYCAETFDKLDLDKKHPTDYYEDATFVKTGRITNLLTRVNKLTDVKLFKHFIASGSDNNASNQESFDPDSPRIRI